jgi:integrase
MASIKKRGDSWKAEVCKKGVRKSASFATKAEAQSWANKTETELSSLSNGNIPDKTCGDLLEKYAQEITPMKRGARWEANRIVVFRRMKISTIKLRDFNKVHVYEWREERLTQVSSSSVNREWSILSNACNVAISDWGWLKENPFSSVKKPVKAKARTRRVTDDDIEKICYALNYTEQTELNTQAKRTAAAFLFAIETAMRAGEIIGLTWDDINDKYAHLPITKNGHARDVPLSAKARAILERLPKDNKNCFGVNSQNLDAIFRRAKAMTMIDDLHFHDSRREALSRMAKIMPVHTLAKISGHRDLRILLNVYYAPSIDDLTKFFD